MVWVIKAWFVQLWAGITERLSRPQGFWHDPGPCVRCGSRVFYVVEDERLLLVVQCAMCKEREAA